MFCNAYHEVDNLMLEKFINQFAVKQGEWYKVGYNQKDNISLFSDYVFDVKRATIFWFDQM